MIRAVLRCAAFFAALLALVSALTLFGHPAAWAGYIGRLVTNHIFIGNSGNQAIDAPVGGDCTMALVAGVAKLTCGPLGSLPNGTQYQMLRMGAASPQWEDAPYDLGSFMPGVPPDSSIIRIGVPRAVLFPSGLPNAVCKAKTAATGSTTVSLNKIHAGASSAIGTLIWSAAGTTCAVTFGSNVTLASGDLIEEAFPGSADATLADIAITLPGIRQ